MNIFIRTLYFYYFFLLVIKLKWFLWTFRKVGFEWRKFPFQGVYAWIDGRKSILFLLRFWIDRSLWIFLLIFGLRFLSNEARRSIAAYSVGWLSTWCSFTYLPLIKSTFSAGAWIPSQHSVTCLLPVEPAFIIKLHHWKESSYRPFNPSIPSCFFLNIILCCMWCIHLYDYHISDFRC